MSKRDRRDKFYRILDAHRMMKSGRQVNATVIAERHGTSERTGQRTFDEMQDDYQLPMAFDRTTNSRRYLEEVADLPATLLSEREALALVLAGRCAVEALPMPLASHLGAGLDKLERFARKNFTDPLDLLDHVSFARDARRKVDDTILGDLTRAPDNRQALRVAYRAAYKDEVSERTFDVYHLTLYRGDWYAIGHCHLRGALRILAASRIIRVAFEEARYVIPADFDAEAFFRDSFGIDRGARPEHVVLELDATQARYARERSWHPGQRWTDLAGGGGRLELDVALTAELRQWILSHGWHARVLAPVALAEEIRDAHRRAADAYASGGVCP